MIQDCYIEEIKDIVKEKKLHMSEQELYFAEREMQKNIIEYNMKIYAAALSAIERVTTYHFPELHPEEKEQLTIATILSEIRECLSSSNYISHFRSANSVAPARDGLVNRSESCVNTRTAGHMNCHRPDTA